MTTVTPSLGRSGWRWLPLVLLVIVADQLSKGWIELRWGRLLADLGLPYVVDPGDLRDCPPPSSSAKQAR